MKPTDILSSSRDLLSNLTLQKIHALGRLADQKFQRRYFVKLLVDGGNAAAAEVMWYKK